MILSVFSDTEVDIGVAHREPEDRDRTVNQTEFKNRFETYGAVF